MQNFYEQKFIEIEMTDNLESNEELRRGARVSFPSIQPLPGPDRTADETTIIDSSLTIDPTSVNGVNDVTVKGWDFPTGAPYLPNSFSWFTSTCFEMLELADRPSCWCNGKYVPVGLSYGYTTTGDLVITTRKKKRIRVLNSSRFEDFLFSRSHHTALNIKHQLHYAGGEYTPYMSFCYFPP